MPECTPEELEAGTNAVEEMRHFIASDGYPSIRVGTAEEEARVVLDAVVPLITARVREQVAEEIAQAIEEAHRHVDVTAAEMAATARAHRTTPEATDG